jgi:hypothetical protein
MKTISLLCIQLFFLTVAFGQSLPGYLTFSYTIDMQDEEHLQIAALGNKAIKVDSSKRINFIPPDIASLDQARIVSVENDTIVNKKGKNKCISHCLVDTLFITDDLFLINTVVDVSFFLDGTYKGESSFGWGSLQQAGRCTRPSRGSSSRNQLVITDCSPSNLTYSAKIKNLHNLDPVNDPDIPFKGGSIQEIRLIKCSTNPIVEERLILVKTLLDPPNIFSQDYSIDPKVPPQNALARIKNTVTIRYFEATYAEQAEGMADCISYLFGVPRSQIFVENMLPYYGGIPPIQDYLEIWFNN